MDKWIQMSEAGLGTKGERTEPIRGPEASLVPRGEFSQLEVLNS
jgi:hypothetical protein